MPPKGSGKGKNRAVVGGTRPYVRPATPDFATLSIWSTRITELVDQRPGMTTEEATALIKWGWEQSQEILAAENAVIIAQEAAEENTRIREAAAAARAEKAAATAAAAAAEAAATAVRTPSPGSTEQPPQTPPPPPRRTTRKTRANAVPVVAPRHASPSIPSSPLLEPVRPRLTPEPAPPRSHSPPPHPHASPLPTNAPNPAPLEASQWKMELATDEEFKLEDSLANILPSVLKAARERRHFPLYYCTIAGRRAVQAKQRISIQSETPQFELRGGSLDLVAGSNSFKTAPEDDNLPWTDVCNAKSTFLRIIFDANWGEEIVDMFDKLFVAISEHEDCLRPSGQRGLVKYFAQARRSFHIAVDQRRRVPDISRIDERALSNIVNRVIRDEFEGDMHQRSVAAPQVSLIFKLSSLSLRLSLLLSPSEPSRFLCHPPITVEVFWLLFPLPGCRRGFRVSSISGAIAALSIPLS